MKTLAQFFSLPTLHIDKVVGGGPSRFLTIYCHPVTPKRPDCPFCSHPGPRIHQHYERRIKDADIRGKIPTLVIRLRRYRCSKCHKTFSEQVPGIKPRARITQRMKREIYWSCENFRDLSKVRKHTTCGSSTIYKTYYSQLELKQRERMNTPWPKSIGIDEHAFNTNKERGHKNFVTLIIDHKKSKPRELLPSRNSGELQQMLAHIPGRENVKNVTMDMSGTYRSFVKNFFPSAQITVDHFHVVRLLHPAINRRRKAITGDKRKNPLRKLLLKNGHKLEVFDRKTIRKWLEGHPELEAIYTAKEALHTLYRCRGYKRAKQSMQKLLDWLAHQEIKELQTLRRTLMSWRVEILNYFKTGLTNAKTEGHNNVAKSVIKASYGFKNFGNYRLRILNP
jgi:transposase